MGCKYPLIYHYLLKSPYHLLNYIHWLRVKYLSALFLQSDTSCTPESDRHIPIFVYYIISYGLFYYSHIRVFKVIPWSCMHERKYQYLYDAVSSLSNLRSVCLAILGFCCKHDKALQFPRERGAPTSNHVR